MFYQAQISDEGQLLIDFLELKKINVKFIDSNLVFVNGTAQKSNFKIRAKDLIQVFSSKEEKKEYFEDDGCKIVHLDDDFIVIKKAANFTSHPDKNNKKNNVMYVFRKLLNFKKKDYDSYRPVVHRLDKPTTGLIILARNLEAAIEFNALFKERKITKKYYAIVKGEIKNKEFIIKAPILKSSLEQVRISFSGRDATTKFKLIKQYNGFAMLECQPITGRTHQIRKHLAFIKHPVLFDPLYLTEKNDNFFLAAFKLSFFWSKKNYQYVFELSIPTRFSYFIESRQEYIK